MLKTIYDSENKLWSGNIIPSPVPPNTSAGQVLINQLELNDRKIAQVNHDTGYRMTRREMRLKSLKIAENLLALGIRQGDNVQIICEQHDDIVPLVIGIMASGAVVNPLHVSFAVHEMIHFLSVVKPKMVICDESFMKTLDESLKAAGQQPIVYIFKANSENSENSENSVKNLVKSYESLKVSRHETSRNLMDFKNVQELIEGYESTKFVPPRIQDLSKAPLLAMCTSGTTGLPKCVSLSHEMILFGYFRAWPLPEDTVFFSTSSLYWMSSIISIVMSIMIGTIKVISKKPMTAEHILDVVVKQKVNVMFTAPTSFPDILKCLSERDYDLSSLKFIQTGGAFLPDNTIQTLRHYFKGMIMTGYSLTDVGFGVSGVMNYQKPNTVGSLGSDVRAKIINEAGDLLGPMESGEICVRCPKKFLGYLNNEKATKEAYREDGWFHTGDLAYFDEDGDLFLVDRKKNMIKYKGFQIAPSELEDFIATNFDVDAVVIVGIPDTIEGSYLPAAIIVRRNSDEIVTERDIVKLIEDNFSDAKRLRGGAYFVDEIPKTISEKFQRNLAQKMATELYNKKQLI